MSNLTIRFNAEQQAILKRLKEFFECPFKSIGVKNSIALVDNLIQLKKNGYKLSASKDGKEVEIEIK